jgi:hypothetical protein
MKGIAFWGGGRDAYDSPHAQEALRELKMTNATWVSIVVTAYQDTVDSISIDWTGDLTPPDTSVRNIINFVHQLGLKVLLKPHVDLSNDPQHVRSEIGPRFTKRDWTNWLTSYRGLIFHYAEMASELGVEMFSVGCELNLSEGNTAEWRRIIGEIRKNYSGLMTYANDEIMHPQDVQFWDDLDFIGVDFYASLTDKIHPTVDDLIRGWRPWLTILQGLSRTWSKPLIFTEIGYRSILGGAQDPAAYKPTGPVDLEVQANCYEAALRSVTSQVWFVGMFWWDWSVWPHTGGPIDIGFTPHGKPAEKVLTDWYTKPLN